MKVDRYQEGTFCWFELATTQFESASSFYREIFGWEIKNDLTSNGSSFSMLKLEGVDVGAMYQLPEDSGLSEQSSRWVGYVAVDDVDASVERVDQAGGQVVVGPRQVATAGRMAELVDPEGARISLWQGQDHPGSGLSGVPGTLAWCELASRDTDRASAFYSSVLEWEVELMEADGHAYRQFLVNGSPVGGMLQMTDAWRDLPSHWMFYFFVDNCNESARLAKEIGGTVHVSPTRIPSRGIFSVVTDPTGAVFSLFEPDR